MKSRFVFCKMWTMLFCRVYLFCLIGYSVTTAITINVPTPGDQQRQFIYFTSKQSWNTARRVCKAIGGWLAKTESVDMLRRIDTLAASLPNKYINNAWVGLHRNENNHLVWDDNVCSNFTYTGLNRAELIPNSDFYGKQMCFRYQKMVQKLDQDNCDNNNSVVCELMKDSCRYSSTGSSVALAVSPNATEAVCQTMCDQMPGCYMAANHFDFLCVLISAPAMENVVYKKACPPDSTAFINLDVYRGSDDLFLTPTPCSVRQSESSSSSTGIISLVGREFICRSSIVNCECLTTSTEHRPTQRTTVTFTTTMHEVSTHFLTKTEDTGSAETMNVVPTVPAALLETSCISCPEIETIRETITLSCRGIRESGLIQSAYITPSFQSPCKCGSSPAPFESIKASCQESVVASQRSEMDHHLERNTNATTICRTYNHTWMAHMHIDEVVASIVRQLSVNTRNLSRTIREKTSAIDQRVSAHTLGFSAVMLIVVPFALIVIFDFHDILREVQTSYLSIRTRLSDV